MKSRYNFSYYLFGATASRLGDDMSVLAILLLGLAVSGSVATASALLAALTIGSVVGGPVLGALLDRSHCPGGLLAMALLVYALGLGTASLLLGRAPVWFVAGLAAGIGLFGPSLAGGWTSQLKAVAPAGSFARATAADALTHNVADLAGPALAGLVAAFAGARWSVAAAIIILLLALPPAWFLPTRTQTKGVVTSLRADIVEGFKVILRKKLLLRTTVTSTVSFLGFGMLEVLCPLLGRELFGSAGRGAALLSIVAAGSLAATALLARRPLKITPDTIVLLTTFALAAGFALLAVTTSLPFVVLALMVVGVADGPQLVAVFGVRHREAPARLRAHVFTTAASLKTSAAALGAILAGQLAAHYSLRLGLVAACCVELLAALSYAAIMA